MCSRPILSRLRACAPRRRSASFAAVGVQQVVSFLERARLPFSRPAAVMLVAFNFTLVLGASESSAQADERHRVAAETFTDQALSSLAPNSLLVARSEAIIHRLLAAQLLSGERPDVLVVPAPLLERGSLRRRLLATEPELGPLLREMALRGEPGEFALSELSDARPLYVEFDPAWTRASSRTWVRARSSSAIRRTRSGIPIAGPRSRRAKRGSIV